ncbi:coiled-coil domain-containing protein 24 isoform X3 [Girardinichthys multiradiatus]|nr:coiled-coil domain-containing protein 24 isoform X3 [Girardinichthys multiradiatus]XP_047224236.1 coiled-coil domain-containing protein 24 isoform X3 [Girardinichthys multiradiatus]
MHSPDENQLWCPRQSLWSLITEHVSEAELLKIHAALGHSLVHMYTEVHSEAEMLHRMWQDSRCYGNHLETYVTGLQGFPLSDPPAVKELVRAEVKMLLETLKERACEGGRHGEELLLRYKPETLNYVFGPKEIGYQRSSNLKNADNFDSRPSSCSVMSQAEGEIEAVRDKLNVTEIDTVITRLRCVLLEEWEALTKMAKHLRESIKLKFVNQPDSKKPEPSLTELKELRAAIQTDLELLPSSVGASSSAPVWSPKRSFRLPAELSSDTQLAPTPKSVFRLDLHKPRPPRHDPPTRTSSVRTLGLHRLASASNRSINPSSSNRMDIDQKGTKDQDHFSFSAEPDCTGLLCRTFSRCHINSKRSVVHLENHPSTQHCVPHPSTDFDWSQHGERKISPHCSSRNINITPSPPPPLCQLCDLGSSSPAEHSVSANGKVKAEDRTNSSSNGRSTVLTILQKNKLQKRSGISLISGALDQGGSKKNNSRLEINNMATSELIPVIKVKTASA